MPKSELRILRENEYLLWDELVGSSIRGTIFHYVFWLKASGCKFAIYGYFSGGDLLAGIPLAYKTSLKFKIGFNPLITDYSGIVFKEPVGKYCRTLSREKEISREIARELKNDFDIVSFNSSPGQIDFQPFIWEGYQVSLRYTYRVNLEGDLENIFQSMDDGRRNIIRKAMKDDIHITPCDEFGQLCHLINKSFSRQKMTMNFERVALSYNESAKARKQCKLFIATKGNGDPISAVYIVWDKQRSYYILSGCDYGDAHEGATCLAIWEAIKFSKQELGLKEFDFDGSMIPRLERFFRGFGGLLTPYYTVSWVKPNLRVITMVSGFCQELGRRIRNKVLGKDL